MKFTPLAALAVALTLPVLAADAPKVSVKLLADGLTSPLSLVPLPDSRALIVDQVGFVRVLDAAGKLIEQPALVWTNQLSELKHGQFDERGLLDLALHPKFVQNRRVFVTYTAPRQPATPHGFDCTWRLSELTVNSPSPFRIDPASEKILLEVPEPFSNHNSGRMAFGPDGFLYVALGDGGAANDQGKRPATGNGQNLWSHLGKILRLDVDNPSEGKLYGIPKDNPFADGKEGLPEIYAYGLRNVWGLSFDSGGTRELFAADVGQNLYEEVNLITKGGNYGWAIREAFAGFDPKKPNDPPADASKVGARGEPLLDPILDYRHVGPKRDPEALGISITGGYVYRGRALPQFTGHYVFADWSRNWGLPQGVLIVGWRPADGAARWQVQGVEIVNGPQFLGYVTGMGQDNAGELYVLTNGSNGLRPGSGKVWKIVPAE